MYCLSNDLFFRKRSLTVLVIVQQVQIKLFCYQSSVLSVEYETIHQFRLMFDSDLLKETRFKIHFRGYLHRRLQCF